MPTHEQIEAELSGRDIDSMTPAECKELFCALLSRKRNMCKTTEAWLSFEERYPDMDAKMGKLRDRYRAAGVIP